MFVSRDYEFAYLAMPKCASRSVAEWLKWNYGAVNVNGRHVMAAPHWAGDYYAFTTVRNPYSRVVSRWHHFYRGHSAADHTDFRRHLYPDFLSYVRGITPEKTHAGRHHCTYYLSSQKSVIDFAQRGFRRKIVTVPVTSALAQDLELPFVNEAVRLPKVGKLDGYGDWRDYYREGWVARKVRRCYEDDFEALGFDTIIR